MANWTHPTTKDSNGKIILKPEASWSPENENLANYNSKALHATFNEVDSDQINLISICGTAKEAWDILQATHKGSSYVK